MEVVFSVNNSTPGHILLDSTDVSQSNRASIHITSMGSGNPIYIIELSNDNIIWQRESFQVQPSKKIESLITKPGIYELDFVIKYIRVRNLIQGDGGNTSGVLLTSIGGSNGGGSATNVSIVSPSLNLESTQLQVLSTLQSLTGNVDGLELLSSQLNNLVSTTNTYIDQVESLLSNLNGNTNNLEILLTELGLNTDEVEFLLGDININLSNGTQRTRITDGVNNLSINPDGSLNTNIPSNLIRESTPLRIQNDISNINTSLNNLNFEYLNKVNIEENSLCVIIEELNIPNIGDKSTFFGYNETYLVSGESNLSDNSFSIRRLTEYSNGLILNTFANGGRHNYSLVFDSGLKEYLTYTY